MEHDELPYWPSDQEMQDFHRDMERMPPDPPMTDAELEAVVSEWLKYYDARVRITDDYYAALRVRGVRCPF